MSMSQNLNGYFHQSVTISSSAWSGQLANSDNPLLGLCHIGSIFSIEISGRWLERIRIDPDNKFG